MKFLNKLLISIVLLTLLSAFLPGCSNLHKTRANNRHSLNFLSVGMTKQEVLEVMGTITLQAIGETITNPYRTEMHRLGGHYFEVILYYTDLKSQGSTITDDELTPIIMKDGRLDGWGWSYWNNAISKYEVRMR